MHIMMFDLDLNCRKPLRHIISQNTPYLLPTDVPRARTAKFREVTWNLRSVLRAFFQITASMEEVLWLNYPFQKEIIGTIVLA